MRVEEIDARAAPDAALDQFVRVEHGTWGEEHGDEPLRPADEVVAFLRNQPTTHESYHWAADGGAAHLYVHGPTAAFLDVHVVPSHRRQGTASALLEAAVERARERGVRALHSHHATDAGAAFAARRGFVDGQRIVKSLLRLQSAELPDPVVPEGWTLATWLGRVPDEHLDAFVSVRAAMDDAPAPDDLDFPTATAETVRASEESLARRDREMRLTVALRDDGVIGAFTELRVSRGSTVGFTDDTGTAAAHRGAGLARAVKTESLRRLRSDHPEVAVVTTSNAEENDVMRHLNRSLGFRRAAVLTTTTLSLRG